MKLILIANFGETERVITEEATLAEVEALMDSLDWQNFHQVVLQRDPENWLEVGGSLQSDGLAAIIFHNNQEFVIAHEPTSIAELKRMLAFYIHGDTRILEGYFFPGLSRPLQRVFPIATEEKQPKKLLRRILMLLVLILIVGIVYYNMNVQAKFIGESTEVARAVVIDRKWNPSFMGYYLYTITYQFNYAGQSYSSTTNAGFSKKRDLKSGDFVLVEFIVGRPEINAYKARIVKK